MHRTFALLSTVLLAAPLALSQTPGPSPAPGRSDIGHHYSPDSGTREGHDRDGHDGHMHEEGGHDGVTGMRVPPGTWWRNPDVVSRVGLSPDQVKRIDSIFLESRVQLIQMHASLEEQQLRLEPLLTANPVNQQAALTQVSKVADTRADLEKANAKMLLAIRGVLTADQWTKLQPPMGPHGGPGRGNGPHD